MKQIGITVLGLFGTLICVPAAAQESIDSVPALYDELDEFVVVAKKEIVKSDGATLTYDMEQDDSSKGQTLLDALRKVPMVTVDGQDNIYIKGSSNFRIYTNGKEDPMLTANYKTVFKSMPAESVTKIEVITEPGAKYDAEGTGGILNLVTQRKQVKEGYTGSASISGGSQNMGASLYGRMRYDKVTADANVNYANNALQKQSNLNRSTIINHLSDDAYRQLTEMRQNIWFNYLGGGLNLSWEPTETDLFTVGADVNWIYANINKLDNTTSIFNRAGVLQSQFMQKIDGGLRNLGASGNTSYRRTLGRDDHTITAAYRFNFGSTLFDVDYRNFNIPENEDPDSYERNKNNGYQREHTATIDYSNSLAEGKHLLEAGAKGIFRRNSNSSNHFFGLTPDLLAPDAEGSGAINQIQDVYALYAAWRGTFGNVSTGAGLRYEHTYMGLDFLDGRFENFRRELDDVVPNASVTYMFGPASNLRAAYQMRISRPSADQMNPTLTKITHNSGQQGNPNLESERHNSVSLTYSNFGGAIGGNVSISYSQTDNSIESYTFFTDGVEVNSWGNFGKNRRTELNGYLSWTINQKMSCSIYGGVNYTDIRSGGTGPRNSGWNGNYGLNWSYSGPWRMKYSIYGGQSSGGVNLQGEYGGWDYYGLSVKKSFLKDDALSLTINAGNFLSKYSTFKNRIHTDTYSSKGVYKNRAWNVGLTLSWNFGHLQDQVKKTDAKIDNEDSSTSKGGNTGGIKL